MEPSSGGIGIKLNKASARFIMTIIEVMKKKLFGNANIRTNFVVDVIVFKETPISNPQGGPKAIPDKP